MVRTRTLPLLVKERLLPPLRTPGPETTSKFVTLNPLDAVAASVRMLVAHCVPDAGVKDVMVCAAGEITSVPAVSPYHSESLTSARTL